jgi:hypothetical protein
LAFEVTVTSLTLSGSSGGTSNLITAPTKVELTHLSGKFEPLRLTNVPAGTYTSATIQLGTAEAVIIPQAGGAPIKIQNITANPSTVTTTFAAVTVGSTPSVLNFDFNLATSVNVAGNAVTFTPSPASITVVAGVFQQNENEQENENGEIEDLRGFVTAIGTNQFTIGIDSGAQTLTFAVDATTEFSDGLASFAGLKVGMVVKVEGRTRADGTLLAKEVEGSEIENGLEAEGIVITTTGSPVTSFTMTVHESTSAATTRPATGNTITVNIAAGAQFKTDLGNGKTKLSNPNLSFDASHFGKGQKVEADDDISRNDNLAAKKIKLKKQALVGTATAIGQNGFTLSLDAANSFFTQLTGESSIKVVTQSGTIVKGAAVANNAVVRVRGLLFFDPAAAAGSRYTLVAGRIDHP